MYSLYGLRVQADVYIEGLVAAKGGAPADVRLCFQEFPSWAQELELLNEHLLYSSPYLDSENRPNLRVWAVRSGTYFFLQYSDGVEFLVDATGSTVWGNQPGGGSFDTLCMFLLGPVLGFVLQLRGFTSLHASSVVIGDSVVAFLGDCGAGKSTLAAAFAERGYPIVSDDVLVLRQSAGKFLVQHGYPRVRLWPASAQMLYGTEESLPKLAPTSDKRVLKLSSRSGRFETESKPLAAIYILRDRVADERAPFTESVELRDGLLHLVANTYTYYLQDSARRARDFAFLGTVASRITLRTLTAHTDPAQLGRLCDLVLHDFAQAGTAMTAAIGQDRSC